MFSSHLFPRRVTARKRSTPTSRIRSEKQKPASAVIAICLSLAITTPSARTLGYGTDFVDFVGYHAYLGGAGSVDAVQVTEWDEPQAMIGSWLHSVVYPDFYQKHIKIIIKC